MSEYLSHKAATDLNGDKTLGAIENQQLIENIFAAVANGDGSLFRDSLADDVVMRVTGQYSWSNTFKGKSELLKNLYGYLATILEGGGKTIPTNIIANDNYVVVEAKGDMQTKQGQPYNNEYCLVYKIENGKITEIREYCDSLLTETVLGTYPSNP